MPVVSSFCASRPSSREATPEKAWQLAPNQALALAAGTRPQLPHADARRRRCASPPSASPAEKDPRQKQERDAAQAGADAITT